MSSAHYQMKVDVVLEHIDGLGHVNNVQYLYWIQEVAKAHWDALTASIYDKEGIWVVRNHFIEYKRPALLGNKLRIETVVKTIRGPLSERFVSIKNDVTDKLLVQCTTSWCYLELKNRRPMAVPKTIQKLLLAD